MKIRAIAYVDARQVLSPELRAACECSIPAITKLPFRAVGVIFAPSMLIRELMDGNTWDPDFKLQILRELEAIPADVKICFD
jgi:hypothetical protein